jgi:hypothetical protein
LDDVLLFTMISTVSSVTCTSYVFADVIIETIIKPTTRI